MSLAYPPVLSLVPVETLDRNTGIPQADSHTTGKRALPGATSWAGKRSVRGRPAPDGPGWFDSSWELRAGLEVSEGLPADASLHEWIEGWLVSTQGGAKIA